MVARAVIVGIAVAGGLALVGCSYTKADDSPVPSRTTTAVVQTTRSSVVGTLPPITNAPTTTPLTVAPPVTTAAAAPPVSTAPKPATTAAKPPVTAPPVTHKGGSVTVQAGAYTTSDAAAQAVTILAGKGFGGFSVAGDGPFRVVRSGLSGEDGDALVQALAAAGISAFVRG
jgi:cell division septation protein DedD